MKRKLITIIISLALFIVLSGTLVYAWWSKSVTTKSISATTSGIVFTYKINEDDIIDDKYEISDLAFFQEKDGSIENDEYLLGMSCKISINIENICKADLDVVVSIIPKKESGDTAYTTGFITQEEAASVPSTLTDSVSVSINVESSTTVYLYMYGIQTDESANNDFLDKTYAMTLQIKAVKKTS